MIFIRAKSVGTNCNWVCACGLTVEDAFEELKQVFNCSDDSIDPSEIEAYNVGAFIPLQVSISVTRG